MPDNQAAREAAAAELRTINADVEQTDLPAAPASLASDRIDGVLFADEPISRGSFATVHRRISNAMCASVDAVDHETRGRGVRTTRIDLADQPGFLKAETTIEEADDGLVVAREVRSLIAAHSGIEEVAEFPETGGFTMPCVRPEWTVVNKFDALHRRAVAGHLDAVFDRGRDLYDLWAILLTEHAETVRRRTPELWERAVCGLREPTPRPSGGYAASPALEFGTAANNELRRGYLSAADLTVWGDAPSFKEAVEAARSLDAA